jgi:hypothetical protein
MNEGNERNNRVLFRLLWILLSYTIPPNTG